MKVLIAIDDSDLSAAAVESVVQRVWPGDTDFRVINVIEPARYIYGAPGGSLEPLIEAQQEFEGHYESLCAARAAEIKKAFPDHDVAAKVIKGPVAASIIDEAAAWDADLIVVGSHGRTGIKRFLLGSVAEKVVSHAPCSVEIVKSKLPSHDKQVKEQATSGVV